MNARIPRPDPRLGLGSALAALILLACAAFAASAGCGLSTSGILLQDGGTACTSADSCDDMNPCTTDACNGTGFCTHTPAADGPAPPAEQPRGTCKKILCEAGQAIMMEDDTNAPKPANTCLLGSCMMGTPMTQPATKGTPCMLMGASGTCGMTGMCEVHCMDASMCPSNNSCQVPSCNGSTGICVYTNVPDGTPTPGVMQTKGDCHVHICVSGADQDAVDDSDVPPVPAAEAGCADSLCTMGAPSNPLHAKDSLCSSFMGNQPGHCDTNGHCTECVADGDCPGATDNCQHPACVNATCTTSFTPAGTPTTTTPAQIPGNCHRYVCLGSVMGGLDYHQVVDDTDIPNSGTPCVTDGCSGGNVTQTPNPGASCGTSGQKCTAQGQCGCMGNGDCTPPTTCNSNKVCACTPLTCAAINKTCGGPYSDGCFGMIGCDDAKQDGNETDVDCGGDPNMCPTRCVQGKKCNQTSDCSAGLTCADGYCCNMPCSGACQACSAGKKGQGPNGVCGAVAAGLSDPRGMCMTGSMASCGEDGKCDGSGNCAKWPNTTQCAAPMCSGGQQTTAKNCDGNGNCTGGVTSMCAPYKCNGTACATNCAGMDSNCVAGDYCSGTNTCQMKLSDGSTCTANNQCNSGKCGVGGSGHCCTSSCTTGGACGATDCGTTGMCAYPGAGASCGACNNGSGTITPGTCDGSGNCNMGPAAPCPNGYLCQDPMTCASACGGLAGTAACQNGYYCDGMGPGACQKQIRSGQACTQDYQCQSGTCNLSGMCM
jgi:hypothetical protein